MRIRLLLLALAVSGCSGGGEGVDSVASGILGGTADTDHPAVMATGHQVGVGQYCTGYLIMPDLVLTAHHCTADPATLPSTVCTPTALMPPSLPASDILVVAGPSSASSASIYPVAEVHDVPNRDSSTLCGNDMAVLQLKQPVTGVEPIALRMDAAPEVGETLSVVGYGQTDLSDPNSFGDRHALSGVHVDHVGYEEGPNGVYTVEGEFTVDTGPCAGDSGGPAFAADGRAVGVMSRGSKSSCQHMVYSRVDAHAEWLESLARDSADRLAIEKNDALVV